jgi:hypothetical protein|tara:strand:- start:257 stop:547 length:291 start_codon:yes stop_codon:yes gene_type:complete
MRTNHPPSKQLVRIERATGVDRKELKNLLIQLEKMELIDKFDSGNVGRGGHAVIHWEITENGRMWRSDIGRFIQLGQRMSVYPNNFFYLPSDNMEI